MSPIQSLIQLGFKESEGWQITDLKKSNQNSFYNLALENNEFSLAWFAFVDEIDKNEFPQRFFQRENPFTTGLNVYRPLFLIITNGSRWYISGVEDSTFVFKSFNEIKVMLFEAIKGYIKYLKSNGVVIGEIEKIGKSALILQRTIKSKQDPAVGTGIVGPFDIDAACENVKPDADMDDSYKGKHEVAMMRNNVLEKMLRSRNAEANDMLILLHHLFCTSINKIQMETLIQLPGRILYVNAWHNGNLLLVKPSDTNIYEIKTTMKALNSKFILIEPDGECRTIILAEENAPTALQPGFFRLNHPLLVKYLKSL